MTSSVSLSARTSDDLFDSSFRLPSFDGTPISTSTAATKAQPTQYCRATTHNATNVPSILVSTPILSSPSSPPPAPNTSRSLRSRFSIGRDSPSSTPSYLQPNQFKQHHPSATPSLNIVKNNPLRRRSTVNKAEEQLAFAQRTEKKGGLGQPPPFDPQYFGGVKPPVSMVSLAGTEQGWVSVPGEDEKRNSVVVVVASPPRVVVDGPSVLAAAVAKGGRGKGGPGWYAGKRKNEKGEIVAIGEDGVEIVIMKLPVKAKAPTPPRPSVRSPSPHPAPSIPLPPIPTFTAKPPLSPPLPAKATTPVSEDISDDLPSTLIREILSRSSSRASGDGSGYFDVYKERISSDLAGPRPVSVLSVSSSTGGGLERRKSSTTSILKVASEIVQTQNEQKSNETLVAPKSSVTIVEEDENQRTPVPGASAIFTDDASLSSQSTTPSVPARTSSLPSSSPNSPPRRPMAFGTRSPPSSTPRSSPTHRNSSIFGGGVDDAHLLPGSPSTPTKYTIVAHNASQEVVDGDRIVSPQAWAEQVAEYHSQEVTLDGPRRESILWEEEGGYTVSPSSSTAVAPSSSMVNHTRHRVSISPSFESTTSTQASSASSSCFSHHHQGGRGSFSSSSDTCPSSALTSSFTLASNPSIASDKKEQLHLPPSTSLNSLNERCSPSQCHSPSSAGGSSTSERSAAVASHKQALLSLRRLHNLEKDALIFALSESKRALDDSRAENEGLRSEVRELGRMMEEIRRALLEEEAAQSVYGTASGGASAVSLLSERLGGTLSTLNSVASSIFPSMNSAGMSRKWSASSGGSGSAGWGELDGEEEEEDEGEMGEMLLSLPLPPMTLPSKRRSVAEVVVGVEGASGEIMRRGP